MSDRLQNLASGRSEPKARGFAAWTAGRGNRREYWLIVVPVLAVAILLTMANLMTPAMIVSFAITLAFIRRLHDLGWSGWLAPVINIGLNILSAVLTGLGGPVGGMIASLLYLGVIILLGVLPGELRANEYGPPPGRKKGPDLSETFG